jgi:Concanavalin A-like lectin/glucanases superfamily
VIRALEEQGRFDTLSQVRASLTWLLLVAGCGRLEFTDIPAMAASPDAAVDADPRLLPLHQYSFAGSLADDNGRAPMTGAGGTLTADGYRFAANQGLRVLDALPPNAYTVDLLFSFEQLGGWRKILDFKSLESDNGFYIYESHLQFVIVAGTSFADAPQLLTPNGLTQVTLTRDTKNHVVGYVNREPGFSFDDTGNAAALNSTEATFFIDDKPTSGNEAAAGLVRRIRIYDRALTAAELQP